MGPGLAARVVILAGAAIGRRATANHELFALAGGAIPGAFTIAVALVNA